METTIDLFDAQTGLINGHTATVRWDDFGMIFDGTRMVLAQPNKDYWYLVTVITQGAEYQVHASDLARCQTTLKPYHVSYCAAHYRYQLTNKSPFEPEPIASTQTPRQIAQACKQRGIAYSQIEISLDAPDYRQFLFEYQG